MQEKYTYSYICSGMLQLLVSYNSMGKRILGRNIFRQKGFVEIAAVACGLCERETKNYCWDRYFILKVPIRFDHSEYERFSGF